MTKAVHARQIELLQTSWSTNQVMHSELVM